MGRCGRMICVLALGLANANARSSPSVTVAVYNYANVPAVELAVAESFAGRSYHACGIRIVWLECATSEQDLSRLHSCDQANDGHPLFLRIVPESMVHRIPSEYSEETVGVALESSAFIYYERVQRFARLWAISKFMILGRTMAHELGHLLLGPNSHAKEGIMRSDFNSRHLALQSGQFLFEPRQALRLRELLGGPRYK